MTHTNKFALFYVCIVSITLFSSLCANNLNSSEKSLSNGDAGVQANSTLISLNFTFTWGPESQRIVQDVFCLKINIMHWYNAYAEYVKIIIEANDNDYNDWDYIGLVFDNNQNGYIDELGFKDHPIALFANNMTQPAILVKNGFLTFAETMPTPGPQSVTFNPDAGYTFTFPHWKTDVGYIPAFYSPPIMRRSSNHLHICFYDHDGGGVFTRFSFYVPEE